jgi:ornithine carbamoyltransferase
MTALSLLSLTDLDPGSLGSIVERGLAHAQARDSARSLEGRAVGLYFRRSSTRTRTSF